MTQAEIDVALKEPVTKLAACKQQIEDISEKYDKLCKEETAPLEDAKDALCAHIEEVKLACLAQASFLPFQKGDFISNCALGDPTADYYEVSHWDLREESYVSVGYVFLLYYTLIRKNGNTGRHPSSTYEWAHYRKADISEDLRLRRCLRLKLRRRLEGGD